MTTNWCHSARKRFYQVFRLYRCSAIRRHTGYLLGDEKESLLIWGDIVHFPHIQVAQPDVTIAFDSDPAAAAAIRSKVLDRAASDNLAVSGMHFNLPTTGKVIREGNSFALNYDLWSPAV